MCPRWIGTGGSQGGVRTRFKGGGGGDDSGSVGGATGIASLALPRPATSRCRLSGANASLVFQEEEGSERGGRGVGNSSTSGGAGANDGSSSRLSGVGVRERLAGGAGWWRGALNAVEDGARLDIYTGSVLDGRWLDSLDSRLSATIRGTRR